MLSALSSIAALFNGSRVPPMIEIPSRIPQDAPSSPNLATSLATSNAHASSPAPLSFEESPPVSPSSPERVETTALDALSRQQTTIENTTTPPTLRDRLLSLERQENPPVLRRIFILTSAPSSTENQSEQGRLNLAEIRQIQSGALRTGDTSRHALRSLLPLFNLLQTLSTRPQPQKHLLHIKEIKEFAKQYLAHMIEAKDALIHTRTYTEDEIISMGVRPLCAVYWLGLMRLIQQGEILHDDAKKEIIFFQKKIADQNSEARLGNTPSLGSTPSYEWLTVELIAIKKLLDTMTASQMQTLTKQLAYKEDEPRKTIQKAPKDATLEVAKPKEDESSQGVPAEVVAFRLITALKLEIDKKIVNPYDPSVPTDDKELPLADRIPWAIAFEPSAPVTPQ